MLNYTVHKFLSALGIYVHKFLLALGFYILSTITAFVAYVMAKSCLSHRGFILTDETLSIMSTICGIIVTTIICDYPGHSSLKRIAEELRSENDGLRLKCKENDYKETLAEELREQIRLAREQLAEDLDTLAEDFRAQIRLKCEHIAEDLDVFHDTVAQNMGELIEVRGGNQRVRPNPNRRRQNHQVNRPRQANHLTVAEIETLPTRIVGEGDVLLQEDCAVCQAQYAAGEVVRIIPCLHTYHLTCIDRWLTNFMSQCPICWHSAIPNIPR